MGRILTPKFAVHYTVDNGFWTPAAWPTRHAGRATDANLIKHVAVVEASTQPGGCNEHLGATKILSARIVNQRGSTCMVVARYEAAK